MFYRTGMTLTPGINRCDRNGYGWAAHPLGIFYRLGEYVFLRARRSLSVDTLSRKLLLVLGCPQALIVSSIGRFFSLRQTIGEGVLTNNSVTLPD